MLDTQLKDQSCNLEEEFSKKLESKQQELLLLKSELTEKIFTSEARCVAATKG